MHKIQALSSVVSFAIQDHQRYMLFISLVKIFAGSLRILKDLQRPT